MADPITPTGRVYFTAGDLAAALAQLPPDTPLFVRGYEGDVDYVTEVLPTRVRLFANPEDYYGQHQQQPRRTPDEDYPTAGYEISGEHVPAPRN